jgi:mono/diheme cytochrome c family protein
MKHILLAAFVLATVVPATASAQGAPQGDPKVGQQAYNAKLCRFCHGDNGEGGFGPDLAGGRGLTWEQFRHAVRKPWGVMLAYNETQLPDEQIAGIYALMKSKPPVKEPGHWHWTAAPASAPYEQRVYLQMVGCGQCHEPENKFGRKWLGEHAKEVNFDYFKKQIYNHTEKYPKGGMGNYSPDRLSEANLRSIYKFHVEDLGMRASIAGALAIVDQAGSNTNYKLTVTNLGVKNVGLDAEGLTAFVKVPKSAKVVSGSGTGYKGTQPLATLGLEPGLATAPHMDEQGRLIRPKQDLSGDVVVWKIPKLAAGDKVELTFTLTGAASADVINEFDGSTVHWTKPGRTAYGKKLAYRDLRTPDEGDHERISPPRMPAPASKPASNN